MANAPSRLDATPNPERVPRTDGTTTDDGRSTAETRGAGRPGPSRDAAYGYAFLRAAGHLTDPVERETAYADDRSVSYVASVDGPVRLGYFEVRTATATAEHLYRIVRGVARRTRLQYFWLVDPDTGVVRVIRMAGRIARFTYDPRADSAADRERLERAREDVSALFDHRAVVDRLAEDLRAQRSALASALAAADGRPLANRERLRAAQRSLDRLLFLYLLVERGVVVPIDDEGDLAPVETRRLFTAIARECDDVWASLATVVDRLHGDMPDALDLADGVRLHVPSILPADSDRSRTRGDRRDRTAEDGPSIVADGFDWEGLVDRLAAYDWRLDGLSATGAPGDREGNADADADAADGSRGTVTPAVLADCSERFVGATARDGGHPPDRRGDRGDRSNPRAADNGAVGAYYTGERIADFVARRALWEALREAIEADLAAGTAPPELERGELYRPASGRRPSIEADGRDGFDALYETHGTDEAVLAYVDRKLRDLTACDPAVGGGAFALAVANVCFEWRSMCRPTADAAALRREIVALTVYGVDVRGRAVDRCTRRLQLWLLAATTIEIEGPAAERSSIPTLPAGNVRRGNSLFGFVDADAVDGIETGDDDGESARETADYATRRRTLDDRYAATRRDRETGKPLRFEDHAGTTRADTETARSDVDAAREAWTALRIGDSDPRALCVEVPSGIPDGLESALEADGFTTYRYKARLERPREGSSAIDRDRLAALVDRLCDRFDDPGAWSLFVEREYAGTDFAPDGLDACHWPLEFPRPFREGGGFDVVVSNPPYGAAVGPEAEPLLKRGDDYECRSANDTCEWFVERLLELAREDGVVACVVPKSVAFYTTWRDVRARLLAETTLAHVFDVGLGFVDVNFETIAIVGTLAERPRADRVEGGDPPSDRSIGPTIHRSRDRRETGVVANEPIHLGRVPQRYMRDAGTIIFSPITDAQRAVLDRIVDADRRLGDVMSTSETTRQLYVPDRTKATLGPGDDPFVERVPWVRPYHLTDVWHADLSDYADAVDEYAVPRVMLKVLRGSRLRAWLDPNGDLVGTEKLVNVPLTDSDGAERAFVYAACNHPFASFYLQKAIFSETTETARVMDGQYARHIPVPDPNPAIESAVARLAWATTLARQRAFDANDGESAAPDSIDAENRELPLETAAARLRRALEALVAACYLEADVREEWATDLDRRGPGEDRVRDLFEEFHAEWFGNPDGDPPAREDELRTAIAETVAVVDEWAVDRFHERRELAVVRDVLK
ncbi:Eco57I restriction-modification methylase domain-containing protein [Halosolutus gelatinilyticus]|uniref:Eco57I restriction-modification methylase domain-containing protein n=1 Tax=Halosolutus gelatinilyticus TaxID=2931975 RepID=UPI001FF5BECC|nr:restriction endonuclease [Halosolutus gelatinilyticus]